jgi:hypothetical protein
VIVRRYSYDDVELESVDVTHSRNSGTVTWHRSKPTRGPYKINISSCRDQVRPIPIAPFGDAYEKIGTIQRRLAWPLHKDDTLFQSGRPTGLNIYFYFPCFPSQIEKRRSACYIFFLCMTNIFSNIFPCFSCITVPRYEIPWLGIPISTS